MQPQVIIDPEFARLIPPHTTSEVAMLTQSCVADGIRDPLKTWQGALLDGHTRYRIAQENDLDYETLELDLPDRDAARTWVLNNQLARRNLHPNGASYLRGKRYLAEVRPEGRPEKRPNSLGVLAGRTDECWATPEAHHGGAICPPTRQTGDLRKRGLTRRLLGFPGDQTDVSRGR